MLHIYDCEILNEGKQLDCKYENIFTGKIQEQIKIFKKVEENLVKRENLKEKIKEHVKTPCDPPVIRYIV